MSLPFICFIFMVTEDIPVLEDAAPRHLLRFVVLPALVNTPTPTWTRWTITTRRTFFFVYLLFIFLFSEPAVRAQLVALDQRGFRTVLVEKTQPGPFGFYIATGVMHGHRGIFISRVSLQSLSPMLSVGDEILYVDDELVKGR